MAKNMGHEGVLTSSVVMATTFLSSVTLTFFLFVLRRETGGHAQQNAQDNGISGDIPQGLFQGIHGNALGGGAGEGQASGRRCLWPYWS